MTFANTLKSKLSKTTLISCPSLTIFLTSGTRLSDIAFIAQLNLIILELDIIQKNINFHFQ